MIDLLPDVGYLDVPFFARLADHLGPWCIEPTRAHLLWEIARQPSFRQHVEEATPEPLKSQTVMEPGPNGQKIATIPLTGILMKGKTSLGGTSTVMARREIRAAANDPDVAGILLRIDSPGGTVAGTNDLGMDIKAASRRKPVWAHADDLMASAAYWAASQATRITANVPDAQVGSIGTVLVIQDLSAAAEKQGIRTLVFRTGHLKGIGSPGDKVTDEQAAHVQALVEAVQGSFDAAVQKGRGLTNKELQAVRHGGVMTATAAVDAKLIDAVQPVGKTLSELVQELKTGARAYSLPRAQAGIIPMRRPKMLPVAVN
jgi:signal peptide peptidase SppA